MRGEALPAHERLRQRRELSTQTLGCLLAAVAAVWFLSLDARHLVPSDEGRYAEIAREMFATGDWVTIRYNGLKYFEKPPFHLWMTALAYHAFGIGEWQARLWAAISGAVGLLITVLAARRWFGARVGLLSGLVLLAALESGQPLQFPGHRRLRCIGLRAGRHAAGTAPAEHTRGSASLDAVRLGRHGRSGIDEGADRHRAAGPGTRRVHTPGTRLGAVAEAAPCERGLVDAGHCGTVVRAHLDAQP